MRSFNFLFLLLVGCGQVAEQPAKPDAAPLAVVVDDTPVERPYSDEASAGPQAADGEISGIVIGVSDGDTIDILTAAKETIRVRLNGIDAPEKGQPYGNKAKEFLSECVGGFDVRVVTHGKDRYGRTIGDVYFVEDARNEAGGSSINVSMVVNGLAWHYVQYAPDRKDLADSEAWARGMRLRLWSDDRHVEPWKWRKLSKEERDKLR